MKSKLLLITLLVAMLIALGVGTALAQDEETTFTLSIKHYIKGDEIDLTREAPVFVQVIKDGQTLAYVPMTYKQRIETELFAGEYEFVILDQSTFDELFDCGPYTFSGGDNIHIQVHEQGAGRLPKCYVKD